MKKELLCIDLDNTLVKSNKIHLEAFQRALKKHNLPRVFNQQLIDYFGLTGDILVKKLYPKLSNKIIKEIVKDHDDLVVKETAKYVKVIPGAKRALKKLKPHFKIAVLSNCKHKEIIAILKAAKIDRKMFDVIVGNDDVKHGKPAPDEIFKAEKILHLNSGYMVGDSIYDIKAAKRAKIKGISVLTGDHTRKMHKKQKPFMILRSIRQLPGKLIIHPK